VNITVNCDYTAYSEGTDSTYTWHQSGNQPV